MCPDSEDERLRGVSRAHSADVDPRNSVCFSFRESIRSAKLHQSERSSSPADGSARTDTLKMDRCLPVSPSLLDLSRLWPCPLWGTWHPQLRLQSPRRRPLCQHPRFVHVQPWIQPPRQQHADLSERGPARVEQTPPFLYRWVYQNLRGLMWLAGVSPIFMSSEGTLVSESCLEPCHYDAIIHTICAAPPRTPTIFTFSFSNSRMTKSRSLSCGTSRIHLNISWVFGRLIRCQKANVALASPWWH